jgi:hypothetical protein
MVEWTLNLINFFVDFPIRSSSSKRFYNFEQAIVFVTIGKPMRVTLHVNLFPNLAYFINYYGLFLPCC